MTATLVAVDSPRGADIAVQLERAGIAVVGVVGASALARGDEQAIELVATAGTVVLHVTRRTLTADAVDVCDRAGARIVPLCDDEPDERLAAAFGLGDTLALDADGWTIADAIALPGSMAAAPAPKAAQAPSSRVIAVWGAAGSPGRSTLAVELAMELARGGRSVGLVDADTHAPSLALALGLADEGPGFAAACRQAELGGLDPAELTRISAPLTVGSGRVDVLTGINRPGRWPELSESRVAAALAVCRDWVDHTVVDVAASLERDEEIVSDLSDGPRRNAATLAALRSADLVVAVAAADPVGMARFLRGHAELRAAIGTTPVAVLANRLRPGALGIDARGQVRRTLDRFAGIRDVWFVPADPRSVDAALLAARPVAEASPRSPMTAAVRRFVGEAVAPVFAAEKPSRRVRAPRRERRLAAALEA